MFELFLSFSLTPNYIVFTFRQIFLLLEKMQSPIKNTIYFFLHHAFVSELLPNVYSINSFIITVKKTLTNTWCLKHVKFHNFSFLLLAILLRLLILVSHSVPYVNWTCRYQSLVFCPILCTNFCIISCTSSVPVYLPFSVPILSLLCLFPSLHQLFSQHLESTPTTGIFVM